MALDDLIRTRFNELMAAAAIIPVDHSARGSSADAELWSGWSTSALDHLRRTFGPESAHCQNFDRICKRTRHGQEEVSAARGIFAAAKSDYEHGYLFSLRAGVTGEVLADFAALSRVALGEDHVAVAAVLASAALEDALKRYAVEQGLDVAQASMSEVIGALKAKGLIGGAQKTLLDTMPRLRDYAMHANWDKLTAESVAGILGFTERFLSDRF